MPGEEVQNEEETTEATDETESNEDVISRAEHEAQVKAESERLKEEYEGKLADKDKYVKEKLNEFIQGKKGLSEKEKELLREKEGISEKEREWEERLKAIEEKANLATEKVSEERQRRYDSLKEHIFEQYGGRDPELKKKLDAEWDLINIEVTSDEDVKRRAMKAAQNAGLSGGSNKVFTGFSGSYVPEDKTGEKKKDENYTQFKQAIGVDRIFNNLKKDE
jgi:hypothetical protein